MDVLSSCRSYRIRQTRRTAVMRYTFPGSRFRMPSNLRKFLPAGLLVLGVAVPVLLAVEATHEQTCDRDCLLSIAGNYVAAALVHPAGSRVSLDPGLKSTENGKPVPPGGGVWATATAVPGRQAFA